MIKKKKYHHTGKTLPQFKSSLTKSYAVTSQVSPIGYIHTSEFAELVVQYLNYFTLIFVKSLKNMDVDPYLTFKTSTRKFYLTLVPGKQPDMMHLKLLLKETNMHVSFLLQTYIPWVSAVSV